MDGNQFEYDRHRSEQLLDEAEALIWALLDDHIDETGAQRLSQMMAQEAAVRSRYVDCVQLHADLHEHFAPKRPPAPADSVVLANLLSGAPGAPGLSPTID